MRYPHVDVMTVIGYALHMSDPKVRLVIRINLILL